jgi:hypothetical protein
MSPNNTYAYTEAVTQIVYVRQTLNLESAEWQNEFHFQQLAMWWLTQMQMQSVEAMRRLAVAVHDLADRVEQGDPTADAPLVHVQGAASNDAAPVDPSPTGSWDVELTSDEEEGLTEAEVQALEASLAWHFGGRPAM